MADDGFDDDELSDEELPDPEGSDQDDLDEEINNYESRRSDQPTDKEIRKLRDEISGFEPDKEDDIEDEEEIELDDPVGISHSDLEDAIPEEFEESFGDLPRRATQEYDVGMSSTESTVFDIIPELEGGFIVYESFDKALGANKSRKMFELAEKSNTDLYVIRGLDTDSFFMESEQDFSEADGVHPNDYVVPGNILSADRQGLNVGLFEFNMYDSFSEYLDHFVDIIENHDRAQDESGYIEDIIDTMDDQAVGLVKYLHQYPGDLSQNEFMEYLSSSDHVHDQRGKLEAVADFYGAKADEVSDMLEENPKNAVLSSAFSDSYARMRERNSLPGGLYVVSGIEDLLRDEQSSEHDVSSYLKQNEKLWFKGYHPAVLIEDKGPLSNL